MVSDMTPADEIKSRLPAPSCESPEYKRGFEDGMKAAKSEIVHCEDCKNQIVWWHSDKRRKAGGYAIYYCDLCDDPFVSHGVCGEPGEFCSLGERKSDL